MIKEDESTISFDQYGAAGRLKLRRFIKEMQPRFFAFIHRYSRRQMMKTRAAFPRQRYVEDRDALLATILKDVQGILPEWVSVHDDCK